VEIVDRIQDQKERGACGQAQHIQQERRRYSMEEGHAGRPRRGADGLHGRPHDPGPQCRSHDSRQKPGGAEEERRQTEAHRSAMTAPGRRDRRASQETQDQTARDRDQAHVRRYDDEGDRSSGCEAGFVKEFLADEPEERRNSRHRQRRQYSGGRRHGQGPTHTAQKVDVGFAGFVDDRAGDEKERPLVGRVNEEKHHSGLDRRRGTDPQQHRHGAERADRGICQEPLEPRLLQRQVGAGEHGRSP
jgi:hypothetical protein